MPLPSSVARPAEAVRGVGVLARSTECLFFMVCGFPSILQPLGSFDAGGCLRAERPAGGCADNPGCFPFGAHTHRVPFAGNAHGGIPVRLGDGRVVLASVSPRAAARAATRAASSSRTCAAPVATAPKQRASTRVTPGSTTANSAVTAPCSASEGSAERIFEGPGAEEGSRTRHGEYIRMIIHSLLMYYGCQGVQFPPGRAENHTPPRVYQLKEEHPGGGA